MIDLVYRYADLSMDLADASLVVLAEEIKENRILTTDFKDFNIYHLFNDNYFDILLV